MKTQIITLITALTLGAGTVTTQASPVKNENVTVLTGITAINKIEVLGNVILYVSDGVKDQVKVYNKYYSERALVQSSNGVLRITSYKAEKLVVWVTAADLRAISAYDNAEVKSFGNLSKIELDVDLHNNATAKLSIEAFSANVTVADQAKVNMSGTVDEYALKYNRAENVSTNGLVAKHSEKTLTPVVAANKAKKDNNDLADLLID
jgi:hypothetical protein